MYAYNTCPERKGLLFVLYVEVNLVVQYLVQFIRKGKFSLSSKFKKYGGVCFYLLALWVLI